ncbi:proteasome assembly chaperone 2 [Rhodnius prolixus]|uniref:Proteasome assembly chaperone 2 n=3 Tax=Rhodnius TaxID=13248 RepID=T1HDH0_RHOPR
MLNTIKDQDYEGCSAIVGCPSVGNVGQLSVDLMVSTLQAEFVGTIWHEALLPFIGPNPYGEKSKQLCSSNDFYYCKEQKLILVLFRVPLCKAYQGNFLNELLELLTKIKIKRVVMLAGLFAHHRDDLELRAGAFRYITCPKSNQQDGDTLRSLSWTRFKGNEEASGFECPKLPGGGFTRQLFNLCKITGMPCVTLFHFCSEGDNIVDAVQITKKIDEWLHILSEKVLIFPSSWKCLFGSAVPRDIY